MIVSLIYYMSVENTVVHFEYSECFREQHVVVATLLRATDSCLAHTSYNYSHQTIIPPSDTPYVGESDSEEPW